MEQLFSSHWEGIFDAAFKKLGDEAVAQDITQEIFISMWENRATLHIEGNIAAYLHGAVKFRVINYYRMKAMREGHYAALGYLMEQQRSADSDSKLKLADAEMEIDRAMDLLPARMRQLISMSKRQDRSIKEIADELGLSTQTVKNQLSAAMKILRENLSYLLFLILLLS